MRRAGPPVDRGSPGSTLGGSTEPLGLSSGRRLAEVLADEVKGPGESRGAKGSRLNSGPGAEGKGIEGELDARGRSGPRPGALLGHMTAVLGLGRGPPCRPSWAHQTWVRNVILRRSISLLRSRQRQQRGADDSMSGCCPQHFVKAPRNQRGSANAQLVGRICLANPQVPDG